MAPVLRVSIGTYETPGQIPFESHCDTGLLSVVGFDKMGLPDQALSKEVAAVDLRQLRSFMSVAQQNGFRRGASSLNIAQPAVSRHIKQLETSLGVELFHRTNSGIRLTEAGQALLRHAEELFQKLANIREDLSEISLRVTGTVRIGAPSSIGEILFAPLAQRVRQLAPEIHLTFTESSCRLLGLLQAGHIDLARVVLHARAQSRGVDFPAACRRAGLSDRQA